MPHLRYQTNVNSANWLPRLEKLNDLKVVSFVPRKFMLFKKPAKTENSEHLISRILLRPCFDWKGYLIVK
jgi:hypothetical protein